ncbi:uncharacterized protein [Eurosta solidaginis]|uniref:uncharacterized protein isoform X1 n=1 Tax=Eurosta solidaginis TaxID=178769 RepID=UPI003530FF3B
MMMQILQYNIQSLKANKSYIDQFNNLNNIDIVCLQEIFSHNEQTNNQKLINFNLLKKTRNDGYGGVAIGFRKGIKFTKIKYTTNQDIIIAKTTNLSNNTIICNAYFPPSMNNRTFETEINKVLNFLSNHNNVILLGDFNARNCNWGDSINTPKGNTLEKEIEHTNLKCLNDGTKTHNIGSNNGSVLDLTFTSLQQDNIKWECIQVSIGGSKHYPIKISINNIQKSPNIFIPNSMLLNKINSITFSDFNNLQKDIQAIKNTISIDLNKTKREPKAWWNESLNKLYRLHIAKRKKANKTNLIVDMNEAIEAKKEWVKAVKEAKKESYTNKIEEINKCSNTRDAWNFINNVKGKQKSTNDWAEEDNQTYLETLKNQISTTTAPIRVNYTYNNNDNCEFQIDQFIKTLNKKKSTAGGCDKITFNMIKHLSFESKEALLKALSTQLNNNEVPDSWRNIQIVPIPKANKDLNDIN